MRTLAKLACLIFLSVSCARVQPMQSGTSQPNSNEKSIGGCEVKRNVLPDGTLEIQNRDCSITRVTKDDLKKVQDYQAGTEPGLEQESPNSSRLRELKPQAPPAGEPDGIMRGKYQQAMNGYFDYYAAGYAHRQKVFEWQLISSKIIFFLVALLVISGVYFAAIQFHEGMRKRPADPATISKAPNASQQDTTIASSEGLGVTTFSASAKGIEVSSPVLGVIILVISLAFFYLYLLYVYPISELF